VAYVPTGARSPPLPVGWPGVGRQPTTGSSADRSFPDSKSPMWAGRPGRYERPLPTAAARRKTSARLSDLGRTSARHTLDRESGTAFTIDK
jgi:hypothetical protein